MPKPPGRILSDLTSPYYHPLDDYKPDLKAPLHEAETVSWFKTPEGRAAIKQSEEISAYFRKLEEEEEECRSDRLLKGLPAYVEPKTIHAKIPDPPWKRKLRP